MYLLDNDHIDLLSIWRQAGPDTGQTWQSWLTSFSHHQGACIPGFSQVGQEGRRVEPDEVELGQAVLVPDEGGVDVVDAADEVDSRVADKTG